MNCRSAFQSVVVAFTMFASGAAVHADVLVSNLSEPFRGNTPIANPEYWGAQSFYTSGSFFDISSIDVIGGNAANSPDVVAELRLATGALGDIDMSAGGLIGTFSAPDMTGALAVRSFTPVGSINLAPSTKYWFMLGANSGAYDWSYANTNFSTGPGALGNFAQSSDAGASWTHYDNAFPFFVQVNGLSSIPEPAGLVAIGIGFISLFLTGRWRRRPASTRI
jgi:hypothetical protein